MWVDKNKRSLSLLQDFYHYQSGLDYCTRDSVIVSMMDCSHWSLAIMSKEFLIFFKFDSTNNGVFHGTKQLHTSLAKLLAMYTGTVENTHEWKGAIDILSRRQVICPQQQDNRSFGWYVIRYAMEYCS